MTARIGFVCFVLGLPLIAAAQDRPEPAKPDASAASNAKKDAPATDAPKAETPRISEAERIARLNRAIVDGATEIAELKARLKDPESEYAQAETAFREIDEQLQSAKKSLEQLKTEGGEPEAIAKAEAEVDRIATKRKLARERFDLAIQERKARQTKLAALEQKLAQDRGALAKLAPAVDSETPGDATKPGPEAGTPDGAQPTEQPATTDAPDDAEGALREPAAAEPSQPATTRADSAPAATTGTPPTTGPATGTPPATTAADGAPPATTAAADQQPVAVPPATTTVPPAKPPSEKLVKAMEEATTKEAAAQEAEAEAQSLLTRIQSLNDSINAERKLLRTARQQADNAYATKNVLNDELQSRLGEGASWAELSELREKIAKADQRITSARQEVRRHTDRLDAMQSELHTLQSEQILAMQQAEATRKQAEDARKLVETLENPFAPQNLLQWLLDHGPRIVGIMLGMLAALTFARILERRLVPVIARHGGANTGTVEERENRAQTLLGVLHNAVRIVVVIGGGLMMLTEVGMNILPLITAAGIFGLAIAFGAQNLIRDYFYGFIILIENQYTINDVVRIAGIAGRVERITLRITILRDLEGVAHFMPHGEIKSVSNLTHGWSRALFDIGVAYKEKPDKVMKVLLDLGKELRRDPEFSPLILDDPEMLGVDAFGDSAVVIRFFIKTRPLQQWPVRRELLRRIKNRFDELGIEIPFPHRTVYHRYESNGEPPGEGERLPEWQEGPYAKK